MIKSKKEKHHYKNVVDSVNKCLSLVEIPVPDADYLFISNHKTVFYNKDLGIHLIVDNRSPFNLISVKTLEFLIQKKTHPIQLIDCSFCNFTKIINSKSLTSYKDVISLFKEDFEKTPILIFYCLDSDSQSCIWATLIRHYDRCIHSYPNLKFPYIFLLQGGYKEFNKKRKGSDITINDSSNKKEAKAKSDFNLKYMINQIGKLLIN